MESAYGSLTELYFLDLFAGSGSLGIEALSRGAASVATGCPGSDRVREASRKAEDEAFASLNDQELKILSLLAKGKTNKEIAAEVGCKVTQVTSRKYKKK